MSVQATSCPRCGYKDPPGLECPRCGVVFAKVQQRKDPTRQAAETTPTHGQPVAAPSGRRFTLLPWLLSLVAIAALAAGFDAARRQEPTRTPQPVSPTPPPTAARSQPQVPQRAAGPADLSQPLPDPPLPPHAPGESTPPPAPVPAARPGLTPSYTWFEGASGFVQGMEEAQREGKAVVVYFYTDWCPYCRELEGELLGRAKVEDFLKVLVKIKINPERGSRERALANQYGVRGYPSLFLQATSGDSPRKIRRTDRAGLMSPEDFVATLERALG